MPIKDILTVLDLAGDQPAAKYALEFGRNYDAHVTGLAVSFEPVVPAFAAAPMPVDYMQAAHDQAVAAAKDAQEQFDGLARLAGVKNESRLAEILTGGPLENVLVHCRPTDLVVIGQASPDRPEPMRELLIETILFESGVPVLLVPYRKRFLSAGTAALLLPGQSMLPCLCWKRQKKLLFLLSRKNLRHPMASQVRTSPTISRDTT
jgi:nucleotide-binding universal stress UspA family protein